MGFNVPGNTDVFVNVNLQRLVLCLSLAALVAACGSAASTRKAGSSASTGSTASTAKAGEVVVHNYTFPPIITAPGATLTLVDRDDEPHTVTANDGSFKAGPFNSEAPGTLVAPAKAGSYPFHCDIHPTMHGTLVVNNP